MDRLNKQLLTLRPGRPYPLGPISIANGMRFTVFSRHARRLFLAIYENVTDLVPSTELEFNAELHKIGDVWSMEVDGLAEGTLYKLRAEGPFDPVAGHHYDSSIYLLDPYAKAFVGNVHDGTMKCVALREKMEWEHDRRPRTPMNESVIYEVHVRGFTRDASSGVGTPGTYSGLVEKIPYLQELGVTAVELLPVQEFGENLVGRRNPETGEELTNYWGYSNIGFFAPAGRYSCNGHGWEHVHEFREMVRALHAAKIEVILDVVFNHTSEGNERGPTLCFRGLDNAIYYMLDRQGRYLNYSGCGNTFNCNHPLVRDFILDCLRYWVAVMHVDGFRFDLASILGRDQRGNIEENSPLVERIVEDPVLRDTKLIAEAWDAGGAYQVGSFGTQRWAEWNARYRDDVRRYWRGDAGLRPAMASRLTGSSDLYQRSGRTPASSINFVTCHDGFTLHDLVSYKRKHNLPNGESNRDGGDENFSMNFGVEGDTDDPLIIAARLRMQKNFLATLFLSTGVPMLLGGDEFGRTQRGNNNAYCQDNSISWLDWRSLERNAELWRFCKGVIAFRKRYPIFSRDRYFIGPGPGVPESRVEWRWHDPRGGEVDWQADALPIAAEVLSETPRETLYLMLNPTERSVNFRLPPGPWITRISTAHRAPEDLHLEPDSGESIRSTARLPERSLLLLSQHR